jgi:hypothetical protein
MMSIETAIELQTLLSLKPQMPYRVWFVLDWEDADDHAISSRITTYAIQFDGEDRTTAVARSIRQRIAALGSIILLPTTIAGLYRVDGQRFPVQPLRRLGDVVIHQPLEA